MKATARLARPKVRKLDANPLLRAEVIRLLVNKAHPHLPWHSPKQISDKLKVTYPNCEEMNISHEAIYQALYVQAAGSLRQELKLEKALRTGRKGRKARSPLAGSTLTKQRRNWVQVLNAGTWYRCFGKVVPRHFG